MVGLAGTRLGVAALNGVCWPGRPWLAWLGPGWASAGQRELRAAPFDGDSGRQVLDTSEGDGGGMLRLHSADQATLPNEGGG